MHAHDPSAAAFTRTASSAARRIRRRLDDRRGRWCCRVERDFEAEVSESAHEMHYRLRFVPAVKTILPSLFVVFAVAQELVRDDQDLMGDGEDRLGVPGPHTQTPVQGRQIRSLRMACRPRSLAQITS